MSTRNAYRMYYECLTVLCCIRVVCVGLYYPHSGAPCKQGPAASMRFLLRHLVLLLMMVIVCVLENKSRVRDCVRK